jgi:hypothetical protein
MSLSIITSNKSQVVHVGSGDIWISLMSTVDIRLKKCKKDISYAVNFLHSGEYSYKYIHDNMR